MRPDELLEATNDHLRQLRAEAALDAALKGSERPKATLRWRKVFVPVLVPTVERPTDLGVARPTRG